MHISFAKSGHPVFSVTSPLPRRALKSKDGGKTTIHHNAEPQTVELVLRTVVAVTQLSFYGAVADWCQDLALQKGIPHEAQGNLWQECP